MRSIKKKKPSSALYDWIYADVRNSDDVVRRRYFATTEFLKTESEASGEITFYDTVTGKPLFIAPRGRTWASAIDDSSTLLFVREDWWGAPTPLSGRDGAPPSVSSRGSIASYLCHCMLTCTHSDDSSQWQASFVAESKAHGWPSFRDEEVIPADVRTCRLYPPRNEEDPSAKRESGSKKKTIVGVYFVAFFKSTLPPILCRTLSLLSLSHSLARTYFTATHKETTMTLTYIPHTAMTLRLLLRFLLQKGASPAKRRNHFCGWHTPRSQPARRNRQQILH